MVFGKKTKELPVVLTDEEKRIIPDSQHEQFKKYKLEQPALADAVYEHYKRMQPEVPLPPQIVEEQKAEEKIAEPKAEEQKEVQVVTEFQLLNYKLDQILGLLTK